MTANRTLTIHHANGNQTRYADTMRDAVRMLKSQYGSEIVIAEDWDANGYDDDNRVARERKLVWATEEDSVNDSGAKAVAEICR